jgi:hypothetical protein
MFGLLKHTVYVVLTCFILLICIVLIPSTSQAVRFGHIKEIVQPIPPEMKCGEPGDSPDLDIRSSNGMTLIAGNTLLENDSKQPSFIWIFTEFMFRWHNACLNTYWIGNIHGYNKKHER